MKQDKGHTAEFDPHPATTHSELRPGEAPFDLVDPGHEEVPLSLAKNTSPGAEEFAQ